MDLSARVDLANNLNHSIHDQVDHLCSENHSPRTKERFPPVGHQT